MNTVRTGEIKRKVKATVDAHPDWDYSRVAKAAGCTDAYAHVILAELKAGTYKDPQAAPSNRARIMEALKACPGRDADELAKEIGVVPRYVNQLRSELGLSKPKLDLRKLIRPILKKKPWTAPAEIARQVGGSVHTVKAILQEFQRSGEFAKIVEAAGGGTQPRGLSIYDPNIIIAATPTQSAGGSPIDGELLERAMGLQAWYGTALRRIGELFPCPRGGGCAGCPSCLAAQALAGAPQEFNHVELAAIELKRVHADYEGRVKKQLAEAFIAMLDSPKMLPGLLMMKMERAAAGRISGRKVAGVIDLQ
jgi:hypothetical protein